MDILKFDLTGAGACFRIPNINALSQDTYYVTYDYIPITSIYGIIGAILGYKGYNDLNLRDDQYPEFYNKLKNCKIGVVPHYTVPLKSINTYTCTTGHASSADHKGVNLIYKKQELLNPKWTVYILKENDAVKELANALTNHSYTYPIYLGQKQYHAHITEFKILTGKSVDTEVDTRIDSLVRKNIIAPFSTVPGSLFIQTKLPTGFDKELKRYYTEEVCVLSDCIYHKFKNNDTYKVEDKTIYFF